MKKLLLRLEPNAWPVFICSDDSSGLVEEWLRVPKHARLLERLALEAEESLHVIGSSVNAYLKTPSEDRVMSALDILGAVLDEVPFQESEPIDLAALPEEFLGLKSLVRTWAIADDTERSERLCRASTKALRRLAQRLRPQLGAIDTYLRSFGDKPLPEAAVALGAVAECACEAELLLDKRRKNQL